MSWLSDRGLSVADVWRPLGRDLRCVMPSGHGQRTAQGVKRGPAIMPGDPAHITITWEVEMINQEALRHFKMFRNPFIDDVQKDADIYMSEEHRYIEAAMLDAARHGGFLAVIGEVGSGKSVMRRKVVEQLKRDGDTLVIYPQMIDKGRLTAGSICDAIIQDVSSEKCKAKLEDKTRQVQRLLLDRAKSGYRACLIIEEAHDLSVNTLKYLKRFYELEDGYRKLLGIILIGQTELKHMFNESTNVDMREVIRRVQVAEIKGLNGHLQDYLNLKFKRLGKSAAEVFTAEAFEALGKRLTSTRRDGNGKVSHAYPLLVNNYTARAMNLAYEMGEEKVTEDVVMAI
jgi:type II secretory pathway predicted ATPase ExeA